MDMLFDYSGVTFHGVLDMGVDDWGLLGGRFREARVFRLRLVTFGYAR